MRSLHGERGAVAVTVAISLLMFLGFAALAIDIGHALVGRNELQNVADAAALAGARRLGTIYEGLTPAQQVNYTLTDPVPVYSSVQDVAVQNQAAGIPITVNIGDIQIGTWNATSRTLTVTLDNPDAVRVTARRDSNANGPISTFLANVMGISSVDVTAIATAALTGTGSTDPADLQTPFGISEARFNSPYCNAPVRFYPTNDPLACGGWHTFTDSPPNSARLRQQIDGMIPDPPSFTSPATQAGQTSLNFVGGNVAVALNNLYNLYLAKRDPATGIWSVLVPVYQDSGCSNPNSSLLIVGYTTMQITNVQAPPEGQLVEGFVQCNVVDGGRGGGADFGTKGSIPGLVQ